jgi:putative heme transporter
MSTEISGSDGSEEQPGRATSSTVSSSSPLSLRIPTISISQRTIWLAAFLVVAILAGIVLIQNALGPLVLLLLAMIIGEAIRPLVVRLEQWRIPRALAVLLIYLVVIIIVGFLLYLLVNPLASQVGSFIQNVPKYQKQLQDELTQLNGALKTQGNLGQAIQSIAGSLAAAVQKSAPALIAIPFGFLKGIFGLFIDAVIILTMTIFWLLSSRTLRLFIVGLFPPASQAHTSEVILAVGKAFGGYVRGTLASMIIIGTLTGLGLALLGVPYALLLGLLAALTELLPYLGPWISGSVSVVFSLIAVGPVKAVEVIILFILIQEIEGNLVEPLVMSRAVKIDPLLVIVAVLIGIDLLGIIGAILAVPVAAGIQVVFVEVVAPAIRRITSGQEASPAAKEKKTGPPAQEPGEIGSAAGEASEGPGAEISGQLASEL